MHASESACAEYDKACSEYDTLKAEYDKAKTEYFKVYAERDKVQNTAEIDALRAERAALRAERDALAEKLEALELDRACRVCLDRPAEIAVVPCGHRFVCTSEECRAKVDRHPDIRCYICREPMTGTLRVF
jgi:hypothetical protein